MDRSTNREPFPKVAEELAEDRRVWATWYTPGVPDQDFPVIAYGRKGTARQIEEGPAVDVYTRVGWDVVGRFRRGSGPEESRKVLEEMDAIVRERMEKFEAGEKVEGWDLGVVVFGDEETLPLPEALQRDGWRVMVDVQRVELLSPEDVRAVG